MKKEWIEWLEIPQQNLLPPHPRKETPDVSSKRCPRCGWLDHSSVKECFRCGYNYLSQDVHADYLKSHPIGIPAPAVQKLDFEEWKFGKRSQGRRVTGSQGRRVAGSQGRRVAGSQGRKDAGVQGRRGAGKQEGERERISFVSDPLSEFFLRLQAEQHRLVRGFDSLISLNGLNIIHYEHQLHTAFTALNTMRGQALLADEVGLGKTIEAGIIMKELIERGLINHILIITPASLMGQWKEELLTKFNEEFLIAGRETDWTHNRIITSFSRLRLPKQKSPLEGIPGSAGVLPASNVDRMSAFPGADETPVLPGLRSKEAGETPALPGSESVSGIEKILQQEYDLLIIDEAHKLKHRSTQRFKFVSKIKKKYVLMLTATPVHNDLTELYNLITILKPGLLGTIRSFKRHFVASSDARRPKNAPQLKKLLAGVMIRNRRSDVNIQFPARKSAIYHLSLTNKERELYDGVSEYIRNEFKAQTKHQFHLLSLTTLQKELCSSSNAVKSTLEKIAGRENYPETTRTRLYSFISLANEITINRKIEALGEILETFKGKFLVFTEFLNTMNYIKDHLESRGISTQLFHGGMNLLQRRDAIRRFANSARVLISTQTGGEGFNLQFCHQLVNYDLPWNPMMVEQRIGRVHRLGQTHDVSIFNLSMHNTIESHVLNLLTRKIRMFELVVGELDLILSELDEKKTFEHTIQDIWLTSKNDEEMQRRFERFGARLIQARKQFKKLKESEILTSELLK